MHRDAGFNGFDFAVQLSCQIKGDILHSQSGFYQGLGRLCLISRLCYVGIDIDSAPSVDLDRTKLFQNSILRPEPPSRPGDRAGSTATSAIISL
eukprot:618783-Rhodomonas_salina.2